MRHILQNFLSALLLLAACTQSFAADALQKYTYVLLSPSDGYPEEVNSVKVNISGYAALCSPFGLCRISDGRFSYFDTHSEKPYNLPGDFVFDVVKDESDNVWVLTNGGIAGYKARSRFLSEERISGVDSTAVAFSALALEDAIYFGGRNKIWKYDYKTESFAEVMTFSTETPFNISTMVYGYKRIIIFSRDNKEALYFYPDRLSIEPFLIKLNTHVSATILSSYNYLWVAAPDMGISCYDENHEFVRSYNTSNSELKSNDILCIMEKDGRIWVGTYGGGINIIDPQSEMVFSYNNLPDNYISSLAEDAYGNVWVGTCHNGAFLMSPDRAVGTFTFSQQTPPIKSGVSKLFMNKEGRVWTGFNEDGVVELIKSGGIARYPSTSGLSVNDICNFDDNSLAIACSPSGLYRLDIGSGQLRRIPGVLEDTNLHLLGMEGVTICNDVEGRIVGVSDRLFRYNPASGDIETWARPVDQKGKMHEVNNSNAQLFVDSKSIYRWDNASGLNPIYSLKGSDIINSALLRGQEIWLAYTNGLAVYNLEDGSIQFNPLRVDSVPRSIVYDERRECVWVGTDKFLYKYYPESGNLARIDRSMGVSENRFCPKASLIDLEGNVIMGGDVELVYVKKGIEFHTIAPPELVVDRVTVDNKTIADFSHLSLHPNYKTLNVFFRSIDTRSLRSCQYHFIIDGPAPISRAEYYKEIPEFHFQTNLHVGHYVISGSCTNVDGSWTPMTELYSFDIKPLWYRSFWFFLTLFLIVISFTIYTIERERKNKSFKMKKEVGDERYNFLVNVNHELRTPLTLITGPVQRLLRKANLDDETRRVLTRINTQTSQMSNMLNTVLTTNKLQEGILSPKIIPVRLNQCLQAWGDEFSDELEDHSMGVVYKLDPTIGSVRMDKDLCKIVFSNMMTNAIKHNPRDYNITVRSEWNRENESVRITVRDHGSGIGMVDMSHLFERYYQNTEEHTGFGIGLAYSKEIIDAHDGTIGAYNNNDDNGASFWFELPADARARNLESDILADIEQKISRIASKSLTEKNILFVDDDYSLRQFVSEELSEYCKKVFTAFNGNDALRYLADNTIDAVISDVMMPEMDGLELCRIIKSDPHYQHIPVILLSARADDASIGKGERSAADFYMTKPFQIKEIVDYLDNKFSAEA